MMTITRIDDHYRLSAVVRGIAVYLNNFAIIQIAQGSQKRRDRFLSCLSDESADLLFSVANSIDLVGSNKTVKAFLKEIANHWFPVDLSVNEVCNGWMSDLEAENIPIIGACCRISLCPSMRSNRSQSLLGRQKPR